MSSNHAAAVPTSRVEADKADAERLTNEATQFVKEVFSKAEAMAKMDADVGGKREEDMSNDIVDQQTADIAQKQQ